MRRRETTEKFSSVRFMNECDDNDQRHHDRQRHFIVCLRPNASANGAQWCQWPVGRFTSGAHRRRRRRLLPARQLLLALASGGGRATIATCCAGPAGPAERASELAPTRTLAADHLFSHNNWMNKWAKREGARTLFKRLRAPAVCWLSLKHIGQRKERPEPQLHRLRHRRNRRNGNGTKSPSCWCCFLATERRRGPPPLASSH